MSQENVEATRAVYAEYAQGDFSYFAEFGDDFEVVTSSENPDRGTYRGEAARRWLTAWVESFDQLTIEATEIIDAGDMVVVEILQRCRPHGSQTVMEGHWWQVLTFHDGEPTRSQMFSRRAEALRAAGVPM